jgi:hypothetical protein
MNYEYQLSIFPAFSIKNKLVTSNKDNIIANAFPFVGCLSCSGNTSPVDIYRNVPADTLIKIAITRGPY